VSDRRPLVAVNGLFLDHPHTGTGVYTREVLALLAAGMDGDARRYVVLGHAEHAGHAGDAGHVGDTGHVGDAARRLPYVRLEGPLRRRSAKAEKVLWEQTLLPLAVARLRADVLYAPYFSLPLLPGAPTVTTVHDLIPLVLPEYAPSTAFKSYFRLVSAATRRADAVVTDSRHSAGDIARVLDVPPERIYVIPLGVDPVYSLPVPSERKEALRVRLGLPERFILYLGGTDPRKNVVVLLRALRALRDWGRRIPPLALGSPRRARPAQWGPDPREEAMRLGVADDVVFLDWIADEDKPALYATAVAFAYPSRYEGFGLPPLEAMAAGAPVLCADSSSLPEVTGDAALLLDPDDMESWAEALVRVSEDDALRADLSARGRVQARRFTWEVTVAGLRDVFERVLA